MEQEKTLQRAWVDLKSAVSGTSAPPAAEKTVQDVGARLEQLRRRSTADGD